MDVTVSQVQLFKALTHPVRLAILEILRDDEHCVCHIEALLGMRQSTISQHLMLLRETGLVQDRRDGWNIYYRVVEPRIFGVIDAMSLITPADETRAVSKTHTGKGQASCDCPKCKPEIEHVEKVEWLTL